MLLLNVLLALAWAALTGQFTPINLLFGFGLGYVMLWLVRRTVPGQTQYFVKMPQIIRFAVFFLWEFLKANIRVAISVVSPLNRLHPGVVAIPLDVKSDAEITLLANLITLTPGTLSLDVSDDRSVLFVHSITVGDMEAFRTEIKTGLERRIQEIFQ